MKSCSERLKDLNTKPHVQRVKRVWWARLKENEPGHAQAPAAAVGKSFTQLDEIFCLKASHTERSIEIARNFALNHGNVRLLRRKRGKQPLSRDEVAKASAGRRALSKNLLAKNRLGGQPGVRLGEAKVPGPRHAPARTVSLTKAQVAKKRVGGHRSERIGEAEHPGPSKTGLNGALTMLCLNTGGAIGAWSYLRGHVVHDQHDVVCLQEVSMSPSEASGFLKMASGCGYAGYSQGSGGVHGRSGGLVTSVRKSVPQRPSWSNCFA